MKSNVTYNHKNLINTSAQHFHFHGMENTIKQLKRMRSKSDTPNHEFITCFQSDKKDWTDIGIMQIFLFCLLMLKPNDPVLFWATSEDWLHYTPFFFWLSIRLNPAHLCNCEDSLSTRHHLVPLVMQHVHVAVRLVTADEFRYVGGERWVLGQSDPVTWGGETTRSVQVIKTPPEQTECATKLH